MLTMTILSGGNQSLYLFLLLGSPSSLFFAMNMFHILNQEDQDRMRDKMTEGTKSMQHSLTLEPRFL